MIWRTCAILLLLGSVAACGASADEDWQALIALDLGPQKRARSAADARLTIAAHLAAQEKALRGFLATHAGDARTFEAGLRLSRLLALRGDMERDEKARAEAGRILERLEKSAKPEQQVEIDFARLAQSMRRGSKPTPAERDALLGRAQRFQAAHPEDRRVAALLAEIATLYDRDPKIKSKLLLDAQALAQDEELKARINDDLKRVELLGQTVTLAAPGLDGKVVNVADYRGRVVLVPFFAVWSEPSTQALASLQKTLAAFPKDRVQMLGVSLDTKPSALAALLREMAIEWPVMCDNQGWESSFIRGLGVNALPTVWLLDREGRLRSLNALENTADQIRQLLAER